MKAIINLTTIAELPCRISSKTQREVNFEIPRELATADTMNTLNEIEGVRMFVYPSVVSVHIETKYVESIVFID